MIISKENEGKFMKAKVYEEGEVKEIEFGYCCIIIDANDNFRGLYLGEDSGNEYASDNGYICTNITENDAETYYERLVYDGEFVEFPDNLTFVSYKQYCDEEDRVEDERLALQTHTMWEMCVTVIVFTILFLCTNYIDIYKNITGIIICIVAICLSIRFYVLWSKATKEDWQRK